MSTATPILSPCEVGYNLSVSDRVDECRCCLVVSILRGSWYLRKMQIDYGHILTVKDVFGIPVVF